jgi:hypothetical protein
MADISDDVATFVQEAVNAISRGRITQEEFNRLIKTFQRLEQTNQKQVKSVEGYVTLLKGLQKETATLKEALDSISTDLMKGDFKKALGTATYQMDTFSLTTKKWVGDLGGTALGALIGAETASALSGFFDNQITQYRELIKVGQTFGGNVTAMSMAAADAGLPLQDFAQAIKENSVLVATTGVEGFGQLQKNLRLTGRQFGEWGLTTQDLIGQYSNYAETLRYVGVLDKRNASESVPAFADLISNMSALSAATGVNRDQLLKAGAQAVSQSAGLTAYTAGLSADMSKRVTESAIAVSGAFSALGEDGTPLIHAFNDTIALGNPLLNEQFAQVAVLAPELANATQRLQDNVKAGINQTEATREAYQIMQNFSKTGKDTVAQWQALAATGDQSATALVGLWKASTKVSDEGFDKFLAQSNKQYDATNALLDIQDRWKEIQSSLLPVESALLTIIGEVVKAMDPLLHGFIWLGNKFKELSDTIGPLGATALTGATALGAGFLGKKLFGIIKDYTGFGKFGHSRMKPLFVREVGGGVLGGGPGGGVPGGKFLGKILRGKFGRVGGVIADLLGIGGGTVEQKIEQEMNEQLAFDFGEPAAKGIFSSLLGLGKRLGGTILESIIGEGGLISTVSSTIMDGLAAAGGIASTVLEGITGAGALITEGLGAVSAGALALPAAAAAGAGGLLYLANKVGTAVGPVTAGRFRPDVEAANQAKAMGALGFAQPTIGASDSMLDTDVEFQNKLAAGAYGHMSADELAKTQADQTAILKDMHTTLKQLRDVSQKTLNTSKDQLTATQNNAPY